MSSSVAVLRRPEASVRVVAVDARARSVRRRVSIAWGLLFFNTLTFMPGTSVVPIPSSVGRGLTQAALPLAVLVALTVNPRLAVKPNVFLCLASLLVVDAVITSTQPQHLGTVYRTVRLAEFVVALWLLTPWWGRADMLLFRCHLRWLLVALGSVLLGLAIAPGNSFVLDGRLGSAMWPMYPTQVGQYAAIAAGLAVVLWLARELSGPATVACVVGALTILLLTHTRTALVGLLAALLIAGLSLFTVNARVRKFFVAGAVLVSIGVVTLAGVATTWLARGQDAQGLATLTGRTNFWQLVLHQPRTGFQEIFGFGLSNAGVNGLPIDSNWLASYMMLGLFGAVICACMLLSVYVGAFFQPAGVRRALALFLVTYCAVASYTEVGFTDVSTYLLHLTVAASLVAGPVLGAGRGEVG